VYGYHFVSGALTAATASASNADLVFEVSGADRAGCATTARVSFVETIGPSGRG